MPAPSSPGSAGSGYRRHLRYGGTDMRASDAERADVADRLSKHYQDGRLDQAEFNERLDRAMNAKTRGDFNGLFADLPDLLDLPDPTDQASQPGRNGQPTRPPFNPGRIQQRHARRSSVNYIVFLAFIAVVTYLVAHTLMHSVFLWLVVAGAAFLWLRNEHMRRR